MHWIDPDSLPEVAGTLERFVLNPHGEVDGFVMKDNQPPFWCTRRRTWKAN